MGLPRPASLLPLRRADAASDADDGVSIRQANRHTGRADGGTGRGKFGAVRGTDPGDAEGKDGSQHHPRP